MKEQSWNHRQQTLEEQDKPIDYHALKQDLVAVGFDICHPFCPGWYNDLLRAERVDLTPLPKGSFALLIGNTKALWPPFLRWLKRQYYQTTGSIPSHPVDSYVRESISNIVRKHATKEDDDGRGNDTQKQEYEIFWSSVFDPKQMVCMQRVASVSGFAMFDKTSNLCIHPIYGAWLSYRAVVVFLSKRLDDWEQPPRPKPIIYQMSASEQAAIKRATEAALSASSAETSMFDLHTGKGGLLTNSKLYDKWLAVRDSISVGRAEYRFSESQLLYHYTKDVRILEQELRKDTLS